MVTLIFKFINYILDILISQNEQALQTLYDDYHKEVERVNAENKKIGNE